MRQRSGKRCRQYRLFRCTVQYSTVQDRPVDNDEGDCLYLFKLTHALNSSYDHLNILKSDPAVEMTRLALYRCGGQVLSRGWGSSSGINFTLAKAQLVSCDNRGEAGAKW
jgi:hypothetical protein